MIALEMHGDDAIIVDFKEKPAQVTKALVRALKRSIDSAGTVMVREIARDTKLQSKVVREALPKKYPSMANPQASIAASLKRIPLIKFNAKGPVPSRGRGRGVTAMGKRYPNAFIATMPGGHKTGVFQRKAKGRLPIRELMGPSLGHVFRKFRPMGLARALEVFQKNFDHEMKFAGGQLISDGGTD